MTDDREFHYVDLSSGRYLCCIHGGFCDERDGFLAQCPICDKITDQDIPCVNRVQRTIKVINGLQDRSKRSVGLISAIAGGVGFLAFFKQLETTTGSQASSPDMRFISNLIPHSALEFLMVLAILFFVVAIAAYASSMGQVPIFQKGKGEPRTHDKWEIYFLDYLEKMEGRHWYGSLMFIFGLSSIALIALLGLLQALYHAFVT